MGSGKDLLAKLKTVEDGIKPVALVPLDLGVPQNFPLLNGSSKTMKVDGSSTPVEFKREPSANEIFICSEVPLLLIHNGTMDPGDFGSLLGGIATGLELVVKKDNVETVVCNLKDNKDILNCFLSGFLGASGPPANGFLETEDYISGSFKFQVPVLLNGNAGDKIFIKVNDALQTLDDLEASLKYSVIPF